MQNQVKIGAVVLLTLFSAVVILSQPQFASATENQQSKSQEMSSDQQADVPLKEVTFAISGMV